MDGKANVETRDFGWALRLLRQGKNLAREGWNGKGMFLGLQLPDEHSANTLPYIWMKTACNNRVPWLASQTDVLATDWRVVSVSNCAPLDYGPPTKG